MYKICNDSFIIDYISGHRPLYCIYLDVCMSLTLMQYIRSCDL